VLGAVEQAALTLSKMAQDLIMFSLPEFGYFTLPRNYARDRALCPEKKPGWIGGDSGDERHHLSGPDGDNIHDQVPDQRL